MVPENVSYVAPPAVNPEAASAAAVDENSLEGIMARAYISPPAAAPAAAVLPPPGMGMPAGAAEPWATQQPKGGGGGGGRASEAPRKASAPARLAR